MNAGAGFGVPHLCGLSEERSEPPNGGTPNGGSVKIRPCLPPQFSLTDSAPVDALGRCQAWCRVLPGIYELCTKRAIEKNAVLPVVFIITLLGESHLMAGDGVRSLASAGEKLETSYIVTCHEMRLV